MYPMSKVLHCRDAGFDCDRVFRADTEEAVMRLAIEHAEAVHGVTDLTAEDAARIRAQIKDE
jgi:predicted small metal-binding protein